MRNVLLFISVVLFVSCGAEKTEKTREVPKSLKSVEKPLPISSEKFAFEDEVITLQKFSNGDVILHAQSKDLWNKAAKEKTPAWCYVDTVHKFGVLYNGFCVTDKRGMGKDLIFMDEVQGALFSNNTKANSTDKDEAEIYVAERNYLGNFYYLGFHNIWLKQTGMDVGKGYVLSCKHKDGSIKLRRAHPGNGYYIRTLKKKQ
jgi:hypothetical protein